MSSSNSRLIDKRPRPLELRVPKPDFRWIKGKLVKKRVRTTLFDK